MSPRRRTQTSTCTNAGSMAVFNSVATPAETNDVRQRRLPSVPTERFARMLGRFDVRTGAKPHLYRLITDYNLVP
jgi:hypothetical protein